jgi:hypothetical protein
MTERFDNVLVHHQCLNDHDDDAMVKSLLVVSVLGGGKPKQGHSHQWHDLGRPLVALRLGPTVEDLRKPHESRHTN